jgi:hypothetical protein
MDIIEHERLSNITLRHKLKWGNNEFIAVLHFTVKYIFFLAKSIKAYWNSFLAVQYIMSKEWSTLMKCPLLFRVKKSKEHFATL